MLDRLTYTLLERRHRQPSDRALERTRFELLGKRQRYVVEPDLRFRNDRLDRGDNVAHVDRRGWEIGDERAAVVASRRSDERAGNVRCVVELRAAPKWDAVLLAVSPKSRPGP